VQIPFIAALLVSFGSIIFAGAVRPEDAIYPAPVGLGTARPEEPQ
jgi:hypothetical protein